MAAPPPVASSLAPEARLLVHIASSRASWMAPRIRARSSIASLAAGMTVVQTGALTLVATVAGAPAGTPVFTLVGPGDPVVLGYTVQLDGTYLLVVLGATPLQTYTVQAAFTYLTPVAQVTMQADQPGLGYKLLEAITYGMGKQAQDLGGVPATRTLKDIEVFDTTVHVTSTLGFPRIGWIRIGALLVQYVSKTSQSFTLRTPVIRYPVIPNNTVVLLAVELITPDGAGVGTEDFG